MRICHDANLVGEDGIGGPDTVLCAAVALSIASLVLCSKALTVRVGSTVEVQVAAERRRITKRQDLRRPIAAEPILSVDPKERVGEPSPTDCSRGRPVGASSSFTMKVYAQDFFRPGKNSASLDKVGIIPGSITTFWCGCRPLRTAASIVSFLSTRPCGPAVVEPHADKISVYSPIELYQPMIAHIELGFGGTEDPEGAPVSHPLRVGGGQQGALALKGLARMRCPPYPRGRKFAPSSPRRGACRECPRRPDRTSQCCCHTPTYRPGRRGAAS